LIKITFDRISTAKIGQNQDFDQTQSGFQIFENPAWEFLTDDILTEIDQKSKL